MKIYFAGAIRGGRDDAGVYKQIIDHLKNYGSVFTEHIGSKALTEKGEMDTHESYIFRRDLTWIGASDVVVAEVTQPSLGVGSELIFAERIGKRVICLFRATSDRKLSAMIRGNSYFEVIDYTDFTDAKKKLDKALKDN